MPRDLMYPSPLDAPRLLAVILLPRGFSCCCKLLPTIMLPSKDFGLLHCPLYSHRMTLVFSLPTDILPPKDFSLLLVHDCTPAEGHKLLLLRLLFPRPRPVLTAPTVILLTRPRLPHLLPPAKLVPAGFSVGGTRHLPCSSCHHQGVLTMVAQHLSLLCQGWVASDSYQTPCPRSCFRRRTSTAAVLPSICRSITLPACNHASTIGTTVWHSTPPCCTGGGWRLMPTGLPLCLAFESKALLQYLGP